MAALIRSRVRLKCRELGVSVLACGSDNHPSTTASINDGGFGVTIAEPTATRGQLLDMPASFHDHGAAFSFVDGHSEIHKWRGAKISPPASYGKNPLALNVPAGDSLDDVKGLSAHTTVRSQ